MATIERLGRETGLWDTTLRTDTEVLTKKKLEYNAKNLNDFDALLEFQRMITEAIKWATRLENAKLTSRPLPAN